MTETIHVDHGEIETKVRELTALREEIVRVRDTQTQPVLDELTREASIHTRDGNPSPIFQPVIEATSGALDRLRQNLTQLADNVAHHIEVLQQVSREAAGVDEDAASDLASVDANLT